MLQIPLLNRLGIIGVVLAGLILAMPNLFYPQVERHNDAVAEVEAIAATLGEGAVPEVSAELQSEIDLWPSFLPSGLVNLGLDLRGGAQLLAEVQLDDVYAARMDSLWPEVRDALRAERETIGTIRRQESAPDELLVEISRPEAMARAQEVVRGLSQPVVSLTGVGATTLDVTSSGAVVRVTLSEAERAATDDRTMQQSLEIIRRRIDEAGTREPSIQRQGADRILIQVPGVGSAAEVRDFIGQTARLTFHDVIGPAGSADEVVGPDEIVLPEIEAPGSFLILERSEVVSGEELTDAQPGRDQNGRPSVTFRFNTTGAQAGGLYNRDNLGTPAAIVQEDFVVSPKENI